MRLQQLLLVAAASIGVVVMAFDDSPPPDYPPLCGPDNEFGTNQAMCCKGEPILDQDMWPPGEWINHIPNCAKMPSNNPADCRIMGGAIYCCQGRSAPRPGPNGPEPIQAYGCDIYTNVAIPEYNEQTTTAGQLGAAMGTTLDLLGQAANAFGDAWAGVSGTWKALNP